MDAFNAAHTNFKEELQFTTIHVSSHDIQHVILFYLITLTHFLERQHNRKIFDIWFCILNINKIDDNKCKHYIVKYKWNIPNVDLSLEFILGNSCISNQPKEWQMILEECGYISSRTKTDNNYLRENNIAFYTIHMSQLPHIYIWVHKHIPFTSFLFKSNKQP